MYTEKDLKNGPIYLEGGVAVVNKMLIFSPFDQIHFQEAVL